jgi:predicted ribosome quality control (RQC) complex YloA/Tae2 family protein
MSPASSTNEPRSEPSSRYFWRYELPGGWSVLAGRTEDDNDILSTELAQPNDWWFHAADVPGSHVILQARDEHEPPREIPKWPQPLLPITAKDAALRSFPSLTLIPAT